MNPRSLKIERSEEEQEEAATEEKKEQEYMTPKTPLLTHRPVESYPRFPFHSASVSFFVKHEPENVCVRISARCRKNVPLDVGRGSPRRPIPRP